ncbi:MAG: hypothetical protein Q4A07_03185 [Coriobacteriales bacterium]|nr:hypothetical protein [Coriobacteriales bacterium]
MGNEIAANELVLCRDKALVLAGLDDYCSCKLLNLGTVIPVAGSGEHDGSLRSLLSTSLESYDSVIRALAKTFGDAQRAFSETDGRSARSIAAR